jgi:hypothetical protein
VSALVQWLSSLGAEIPPDWNTFADHVTIAHQPSRAHLARFPWGLPCEMRVLGVAADWRAQAVHVDVPDWVPPPSAAVPHVTVACAGDVRAMVSGDMLAESLVNGGYMAGA